MIFIETVLFTKYLPNYLSDDEYRSLQSFLMQNPNMGDVIQGTGGLRKLRWASNSKGKRGGVRIIYYSLVSKEVIYFMTLYAKNEMTDLTLNDKKQLRQILESMLQRH